MLPLILLSVVFAGPTDRFGEPLPVDTLPALAGTVRAAGHGADERLVGAVVEARQDGRLHRAVAGVGGRYRLEGLRPGAVTVSVQHIAAHSFEVEIVLPGEGSVALDLELETRVLTLPGIRARAPPTLNRPVAPASAPDPIRSAIGLRGLDSSPGMAEAGLAGPLPGEEIGDADRVLFMRGSAVDARVVLLDGAPVLTPFHVAGLVEPFDPELLGAADLYLGGAPSVYSGGISQLLDLATRAPRRDRFRGLVSVDGIGARAVAEAPLPAGGSALVGARGLHGLLPTLGESDRFPYRFEDLMVRVGAPVGMRHAVRVTAFRNREGVRLEFPELDDGTSAPARWGNRVFSLGYEGLVGPVRLEGAVADSRYASALPVLFWPDPVIARAGADRTRLDASGTVSAGNGAIRMGASTERIRYHYRLDPVVSSGSGVLVGRENLSTTAAGLFGEWAGAVGSDLFLRAGVRLDHHVHEGGWRIGPRISARYPLGERATLRASAGRYHQALPAPGLRGDTDPGGGSILRWDPAFPVASATHLLMGLEQEVDDDILLDVSGYFKAFSGMGEGGDARSRASGAELRLVMLGDRVGGWLGYQISWFWTLEGDGGSARFDGRHLLSIGFEAAVAGHLELGGTLGFGAGLPMSAVRLHVEPTFVSGMAMMTSGGMESHEFRMNAGRSESPLELAPGDDFLRLDLEVAWPFAPHVGSYPTELRPYLKVINALDQRDALFYYFDGWRGDEVRPLARRPFLPLVGLEWRF